MSSLGRSVEGGSALKSIENFLDTQQGLSKNRFEPVNRVSGFDLNGASPPPVRLSSGQASFAGQPLPVELEYMTRHTTLDGWSDGKQRTETEPGGNSLIKSDDGAAYSSSSVSSSSVSSFAQDSTESISSTLSSSQSVVPDGADSNLSAKELKALKKQEKQMRRQQKKIDQGKSVEQSIPSQAVEKSGSKNPGSSSSKPPRAGVHSSVSTVHADRSNSDTSSSRSVDSRGHVDPSSAHQTSSSSNPSHKKSSSKKHIIQRKRFAKEHSFFEHLPQNERTASVSRNVGFSGKEVIHPSVLRVALEISEGIISGANARCLAMLKAFSDAISAFDFSSEADDNFMSYSRRFSSYFSQQVQFLDDARAKSIGMGNAIRYLKSHMSEPRNINTAELSSAEYRTYLLEVIDDFVSRRIVAADQRICELGVERIVPGDVILTFARSSIVEQVLLYAHQHKRHFRVIVADSRPKYEGRKLLRCLDEAGIECTYIALSAISNVMVEVTKVFLGASAMVTNGGAVSRTGTAIVSMMARQYHVPVIFYCETYKFSERVQLDALCVNELGDPDDLICRAESQRGSTLSHSENARVSTSSSIGDSSVDISASSTSTSLVSAGVGSELNNWRSIPELNLLNLVYDLTPMEYIDILITDLEAMPPSSVPVVIREFRKEISN